MPGPGNVRGHPAPTPAMKEEAPPTAPADPTATNVDAPLAGGFARRAVPRQFAIPVLHEILAALAHGEPKENVLHLLTEKARLLTDCASAAIALLDPDRASVTFVAASGGPRRATNRLSADRPALGGGGCPARSGSGRC